MMVVYSLALKRAIKQKITLVMVMLFPIIIILIPPFPYNIIPFSFTIYGLVIMFTAFILTKQVLDDRAQKTIVRIAASPLNHYAYVGGHVSAYMSILFAQILFFMGLAVFRYSFSPQFFLVSSLIYIVFALMSIAFSLFWHLFFKSYATSIAVYSVVANIMALAGGLTVPLEMFPERVKDVVVVLPTYWFAYSLDASYNGVYTNIGYTLAILVAFTIGFFAIGSKRSF